MKFGNAETQRKEAKLRDFVNRLYDAEHGELLRQTVEVVARAYEDNPLALKKYFNSDDAKLAGVATSAYHALTGEIAPIQSREFGGLGATIVDSEHNLSFGRHQLHFAQLFGTALQYSTNSGTALQYSTNSGNALRCSTNSGNALLESRNSGNAERCAVRNI